MKRLAIGVLLLAAAVLAEERWLGSFRTPDRAGWESKTFKGATDYRFVADPPGPGLRAEARAAASALIHEAPIDLARTPVLRWSWRVENVLSGIDERAKEGDDYPARVYVIFADGPFFWQTRALTYVWSSTQPAGTDWLNAYTERVPMLALRDAAAPRGEWVEERRNVREDIRRLTGIDVLRLDAVAIMTDTDNSGQTAVGWYRDLRFSAD